MDEAVPRDLLRDAVFVRLVDRILSGAYRVGQRLRLDELATELGVSRTPVREALVPLEALRLVRVQRYVGVMIAAWSPDDMVERLQVAQAMFAVPYSTRSVDQRLAAVGVFDANGLRGCRSEGGRFTVLAAWVLRRLDRPVSAEWVASQHAVLDAFYTREVACRHGLDVAVGGAERAAALAAALGAIWDDDVVAAVRHLDAFVDGMTALDERFRRGERRRVDPPRRPGPS